MFIGYLSLSLFIPQSSSLKDRRQVLNSLRDKLRNRFNISFAQEESDKWQRANISIVAVNPSKAHLEKVFSAIEKMLNTLSAVQVLDSQQEFL